MPVRIKPVINLGPCYVTRESLESIVKLIEEHFPFAVYSAYEDVWEVFDEPSKSFVELVSQRYSLQGFSVDTEMRVVSNSTFADKVQLEAKRAKETMLLPHEQRRVVIKLNEREAYVQCFAPPTEEHWFEHFLHDFGKHIQRPRLPVLIANRLFLGIGVSFSGNLITGSITNPSYCHFVFKKKLPSPLLENIKANLVSNVIWLILGALGLLFAQWVLKQFGVDLTPWN